MSAATSDGRSTKGRKMSAGRGVKVAGATEAVAGAELLPNLGECARSTGEWESGAGEEGPENGVP